MTKPVRTPATYADLEAAPDYLVAEIIDGVLETHHHGMMHHALVRMATTYVFARRPEFDCLHLPEMHFNGHVLVPDMAGWKRGKIRCDDTPWSDVPTPDWVMEIVYPHTEALDRGAKRRIYAEAGVSDLWLFNPKTKVLEAFQLESGRYVLTGVATGSDRVQLPPFSNWSFPLSELWDIEPETRGPHPEPVEGSRAAGAGKSSILRQAQDEDFLSTAAADTLHHELPTEG